MKKLLWLFTGCFFSPLLLAKTVDLSSPDGKIIVSINDDKVPNYSITMVGEAAITKSRLGLRFKKAAELGEGFAITAVKRESVDNNWQQPWGERKTVNDKHNEIVITFSHQRKKTNHFNVRFRAFNDGIGFRYEVAKQQGLAGDIEITNELTEFAVADAKTSTAWWIPSRGWNRYEYLYQTSNIESIDRVHTPFTFKYPSGLHISIHEAALVDYAGMTLSLIHISEPTRPY